VDVFSFARKVATKNVTRANHRFCSSLLLPSFSPTGEQQSEIHPTTPISTCCSCFFSIVVGRKQSQSSVYVNQCSVGGRVMTLVCKNNTSSTRERAFAFASSYLPLSLLSLSPSLSLSCAHHIMPVDRLGKRVLLLLLLLFLD
jgi:hypothetical protein